MATLYFKVQADYDKVIRLREEIDNLKEALNSVDTSKSMNGFDSLNAKLQQASSLYEKLTEKASTPIGGIEDFKKAIESLDLKKPSDDLKSFDDQLIKMCTNLNTYFDSLQQKLQGMSDVLGGGKQIADNIKVNDSNVSQIEDVRQKNAELTEEIKRQQEEISKQQQQWNELANAVRTNNVPAIQALSQKTDEASKRMNLDEARNSLNGINSDMDMLADRMAKAQGETEGLKATIDDMWKRMDAGDKSVTMSSIEEMEGKYAAAKKNLEDTKEEYNGLNEEQKKYVAQLQEASGHHVRIRTQIMQAREELIRMQEAGMSNTMQFQKAAEQAGLLRRQMTVANATMQYFSSPTRGLLALKSGLQGAAGAAGLVVGVFGLFNEKSQKAAVIQQKLMSLMAITVGLEQTYGLFLKSNMAMQGIMEIQRKASAKAIVIETVAKEASRDMTIKETIAQAAFNTVAKANPYILMATLIITVVGAVWALVSGLNAQKKAQSEVYEHAKELQKMHQQWAESVADSVSGQIMAYKKLQEKWNELGNNLSAKKKFVIENKNAFHDLGFSVDSVSQAESLFVKNTDSVVNALMARAEAAAYEQLATETIKKKILKDKTTRGTVSGGGYKRVYKAGGTYSSDYISNLSDTYGVRLTPAGTSKNFDYTGDAINGYKLTKQGAEKLQKAENERQRKKLNANLSRNQYEYDSDMSFIKKGIKTSVGKEKTADDKIGVKKYDPAKDNNTKITNKDVVDKKKVDAEKVNKQENALSEAERKQKEDNANIMSELDKKIFDSQIEAMKDDSNKKILQLKKSHNDEIAEIDKEQNETLQKKIADAKSVFNSKGGKGTFDASSITLSKEETDKYNKLRILSDQKYENEKKKIQDSDEKDLNDFFQKYGTYEEKKLAITKDYEKKISDASSEGMKMSLTRQFDDALKDLDMSNIKDSIDWNSVFSDLNDMSISSLKKLSGQLQDILETNKNLAITDIKEISDKIRQINDQVGKQTNWFYSPTIERYKNAKENTKNAESAYRNASLNVAYYDAGLNLQKNKTNGVLSSIGISVDSKDIKSSDRSKYVSRIDEKDTKSISKVNSEFDKLAKAESRSTSAKSKEIEASKNVANAKKKEEGSSLDFRQKIGSIGESLSSFNEKIKDLPSLVDNLGLSGTGVGNAINSGVNAANDAAGAMADYASGNYIGAASKGLSAIGNAADALGITGDSDKTLQQDIERLAISNEDLKSAIESLSDDLNKTSTANASSVYNQQISDINQQMENTQEMMSRSGAVYKSGWKGSRSSNYRIRKGMSSEDWKRVSDAAGTSVTSAEDFWNLTSEQMANVAKNATDLYSKIKDLADNGYGDAAKYMDEYISYYKQLEEIQDAYKEKLTNTSLDTIRDDFKNALLDMESDTKTFTDNFEKMMQKAVIESMMSTTYEKKLKEWYESFSKDMNDGTLSKSEQGDLKSSWDSIVKEALAQRDALKSAMGWNTTDSQTATSNSIQNITADQSDQLIGRITAIQIAVEKANMNRDVQTSQLSAMNIPLTSINQKISSSFETLNDSRNLLAEATISLKQIEDNTGSIVKPIKQIQEDIAEVKKNTKNL